MATLQVLNPQIKLYHINTLFLQAGTNSCLSLLTIDRRESKYYGAVYQQKKYLLETQIIPKNDLKKLKEQFTNFLVLKDFQNIDF